jgi:uncharacterized RDD family membrane protein YckC
MQHLPMPPLIIEDFGGFWLRVAACLIDTVILFLPVGYSSAYVRDLTGIGDAVTWHGHLCDLASVTLVWGIYTIPMWLSRWQATIGKRICGLIVVTQDGTKLRLGRALGRYAAGLLSGLVIVGVFFVAFTERRQALHDIVARTVVLKRKSLSLAVA